MLLNNNAIGFLSAESLTIASDAITVTSSLAILSPESSTADDLATITLNIDNTLSTDWIDLYLFTASGNTITLKHNTGNILCRTGADMTITEQRPAHLRYNPTISKWTIFTD